MKKRVWMSCFIVSMLTYGQLHAQSIKIDAYRTCYVAMINKADIGKSPYGWWDIWHKIKKKKSYKSTPCTFKNITPGTYTLVVYDAQSEIGTDKGDGVVLKEIVVSSKFKMSAYYQKSDFKVWNCLSCPWLYVHNGQCYVRETEILKDVVGRENKTTTQFEITPKVVKKGILKLKIQEEKDEVTHLDRLLIKVNGKTYWPHYQGKVLKNLTQEDAKYLKLKKGQSIELIFKLPTSLKANERIMLESTGFYIPDAQFLRAVYQKYLITDK